MGQELPLSTHGNEEIPGSPLGHQKAILEALTERDHDTEEVTPAGPCEAWFAQNRPSEATLVCRPK